VSSVTIDRDDLQELLECANEVLNDMNNHPDATPYPALVRAAQAATVALNHPTASPAPKPWPSWLPPVSEAPGWAVCMVIQLAPVTGRTEFWWCNEMPTYDGDAHLWRGSGACIFHHSKTVMATIKMPISDAIWRIPGR
jgi:hypothetical protein